MLRCMLWALAAAVQPKALLIADNLCLRQAPQAASAPWDRRFWILACRWFNGWQTSLLVVKPETVLRWHRQGWRTIGAGVHTAGGGQAAAQLRWNFGPSSAEWPRRTDFGVSGGSRRSWRGSDSRFQPEQSPSICNEPIVAGRPPLGGHSWGSTARRSGRATSSASERSRSERCTCSS
jgi:hypothetical protein